MKEFVYNPSDAYISKTLVNRKRKNNLETEEVTEVKLYSSSKKIGYNYYQCNLGAIVRIFYDNEQRFFANIVYTTLVDFLVDPTDLEAEDKIENILKTVVPKDVLYNLLRNKIYTVTMESGVSPLMISDNYPYEYIDQEEEGEEEFDELLDDFPCGDSEGDSCDDDDIDDDDDSCDDENIEKENKRLEEEASKYTYEWLLANARHTVEGRKLLESVSDELVSMGFEETAQGKFYYSFFDYFKFLLPDYLVYCESGFEFILYSLIFGEADNIKSDNKYEPSLYFTWRGTEYYLAELKKEVFEKIIVEMFIQSFETGRKIISLQPDYTLLEDLEGEVNTKLSDLYALYSESSPEKKEFCDAIYKRIKDCNNLKNLINLID
ncbi:MAG: hypothetical protein IKA83_07390 [Paludibacteraceae bacterium]|nr:hypothetical protein [Paludibacteraceae bacterium]